MHTIAYWWSVSEAKAKDHKDCAALTLEFVAMTYPRSPAQRISKTFCVEHA
jgi:hypothetical protein